MPRADDMALFNVSFGEVAAGVGAEVVGDEHFAAVEEDAELKAADFDVFAFAFFEFGQIAEGGPGHGSDGRYLASGAAAGGVAGAVAGQAPAARELPESPAGLRARPSVALAGWLAGFAVPVSLPPIAAARLLTTWLSKSTVSATSTRWRLVFALGVEAVHLSRQFIQRGADVGLLIILAVGDIRHRGGGGASAVSMAGSIARPADAAASWARIVDDAHALRQNAIAGRVGQERENF